MPRLRGSLKSYPFGHRSSRAALMRFTPPRPSSQSHPAHRADRNHPPHSRQNAEKNSGHAQLPVEPSIISEQRAYRKPNGTSDSRSVSAAPTTGTSAVRTISHPHGSTKSEPPPLRFAGPTHAPRQQRLHLRPQPSLPCAQSQPTHSERQRPRIVRSLYSRQTKRDGT